MSLVLTTVVDGAVISAPALRVYCGQVETYINQEIAAADLLQTSWVKSTHIFGGQFYGAPNPRGRFETGQTVYRHVGMDPLRERVFHNNYNTQNAHIEGLNATFCVPESLNQGTSPRYDLLVEATFWSYTFGGEGGLVDNSELAAVFRLRLDGQVQAATDRNLPTGDGAAGTPYNGGIIYARKNHHMVARLLPAAVGAGLHSVGVVVDVQTNTNLRHVLVGGRTLRAAWYMR